MEHANFLVLGAGLAGLSASYHLGHSECIICEKKSHAGGHIYSEVLNGFTWDEGPHVSFTKYPYVKELFTAGAKDVEEFKPLPTNYYKGVWIPHPAQSNLYALPEELRKSCLDDFLSTRSNMGEDNKPTNYQEWIELAFGKVFANTFPKKYTEKYWTVSPEKLGTEWVGGRVYYPDIETVKSGALAPLEKTTNYITSIRYPSEGGYYSFAKEMLKGANIFFNKEVVAIDLKLKKVSFSDNSICTYDNLISTIPLDLLVKYCKASEDIVKAADKLLCTELLVVNVEVNHTALRSEQWLYVYDEDKISSRINFVELLSPNNAPAGKSGIQVEVYFSKEKPITHSHSYYAEKVLEELLAMGLITGADAINEVHTRWVQYANVVFDHYQKNSVDTILNWLTEFGLVREDDDLMPMTDWESKIGKGIKLGSLILAGRFGQWKYYWTDDCVLRGKYISECIELVK